MQVRVPAFDWPFIGDPDKTGYLIVHGKAGYQRGTNVQFVKAFKFLFGYLWSTQRIGHLDYAQMFQALPQPWPRLDRLTRQYGRITASKPIAERLHVFDFRTVVTEQRDKGRIGPGRFRQLFHSVLQLLQIIVVIQVLYIDRDLGLQGVDGAAIALSDPRTAVSDSRCAFGFGRIRHFGG
jgi:hypothetical protein